MEDSSCAQCGHPDGPHELRSNFFLPVAGREIPVAGWRVCPEDGCECWATWSISHPDLPADVVVQIEACLQFLREDRAFELGG